MGMDSYRRGLFSEFIARMYLRMHGFHILKTRYITGRNTGRAEIDIIARRKNLIIFVEVKARTDITTGVVAITPAQMVRLRAAAETYLRRIQWSGDARFDAIIVTGWHVQWIRQMF